MGKSEEQKVTGRGLAETELGSGAEILRAKMPAKMPTPPIIVQESDTDEDEDEEEDLFIGRVLGGLYKVEYKIGEGGMGTVYAALHIHLNKHFAIKVLSNRVATNKHAIERLRQEAVMASSIDHDNIVDVVSFDTTDGGDVFIVMELLKGAALADVLEKGRIPLDRALHIAIQMCAALHAAHETGIVHRDLKPENIFIVRKNDRDFVKVLDFGISMVKSAETEQVRMTKTGQLVGTPLYMSPEQARGESNIDRRVDIYAMGVILYEMLTGLPPFEGGNYFQLLWKHGNEAPEPATVRAPDAEIPPQVDAAILRALAKTPDERFSTMDEMRLALKEMAPDDTPLHLVSMPSIPIHLQGRAAAATQDGPRPLKSKLGLGLGVAAVVLSLVGIAIALGGRDNPAQPPPVTGTEPDEATLVPEPTPEELPSGLVVPGEEPVEQNPRMVSVTFASRPPGALVSVDGRELGETPLVAPLALNEGAFEVTFSKNRFVDDVVSVVPVAGARVEGRLRPIRRDGTMAGGMSPPIKTSF